MAITYVGAGSGAYGNNASVSPGLPSGLQAGDVMLLFAAIRENGATVNVPSGWTSIGAYQAPATEQSIRVCYRIYQSGDSAPTITFSGGGSNDTTAATIHAWRGADTPSTASFRVATASGTSQVYIDSRNFTGSKTINVGDAIIAFGFADNDSTSGPVNNTVEIYPGGSGVLSTSMDWGSSALGADASWGLTTAVALHQTTGASDSYTQASVSLGTTATMAGVGIVLAPSVTTTTFTYSATGGVKAGGAASSQLVPASGMQATASASAAVVTAQLSVGAGLGALAVSQATASVSLMIGADAPFSSLTQDRILLGGVSAAQNLGHSFASNGSTIVGVARDSAQVSVSTDGGKNWTLYASALPTAAYWNVVHDGTRFVAAGALSPVSGNIRVAHSTDGVSWTTVTTSITYSQSVLHMVALGSRILMVPWGSSNGYISDDGGANWTAYTFPYSDLSTRALKVMNGWIYTLRHTASLWRSSDGITWYPIDIGTTTASLRGAAYGNGVYLLVGVDNRVFTSRDGERWKQVSLTGAWMNAVFSEGWFVILNDTTAGQGDYDILYSRNGSDWLLAPKTTARQWTNLIPMSGGFLRVDYNGGRSNVTLTPAARSEAQAYGEVDGTFAALASVQTVATADLSVGPGATQFESQVGAVATSTSALTTQIRLASSRTVTVTATSALTTSIRLVASTTAQTNQVLASLNTGIPLVGSAAALASQTSALTVQTRFAAAASASSSVDASLAGASAALASSVTSASSTTAILSTQIEANASVQALCSVSAALTVGALFAASSAAQTNVSADLTVGARLAASSTAQATASASLLTAVRFTASETAQTNTVLASLNTGIPLVAQAAALTTATPALTAVIRLAASAAAQTTITAGLAAGVAELTSTVSAVVASTAALTTQITLAGSCVAASEAVGALTNAIRLEASTTAGTNNVLAQLSTGETVSASAAAETTATAILTASIRFVAQAPIAANTSAALNTGITLGADVAVEADAAAGLTVGALLSAGAQASAAIQAELEVAARFSSLADVAALAYADLATDILLAADASVQTELQGVLTTALTNLGTSGFRIVVPAELRTVSVPANDSVLRVPWESRGAVVAADANLVTVPADLRAATVSPD